MRNLKWDRRFYDLALTVSSWSKDPSTKVGCVIVDDHRRIQGVGYNGFPRKVEDTLERLINRDIKYLMVQHAEANAILNCVGSVEGSTAYVTHKPCANCTGILIQSGISRIVTSRPDEGLRERFCDSFDASDDMLKEAGIIVDYIEDLI